MRDTDVTPKCAAFREAWNAYGAAYPQQGETALSPQPTTSKLL